MRRGGEFIGHTVRNFVSSLLDKNLDAHHYGLRHLSHGGHGIEWPDQGFRASEWGEMDESNDDSSGQKQSDNDANPFR